MNVTEFCVLLAIVSYCAGLLGSLTGLGGGIIITPVLVLLFKVDIHIAMGASLIAVIATSSGAALSFIRGHYTNVPLGMFLESGTVVGAIIGALLLPLLPVNILLIAFGSLLMFAIWFSLKKIDDQDLSRPSHPWAVKLKFAGVRVTTDGPKAYHVYNVPQGLGLMVFAGALSGLLGIGSGSFKVLALDLVMGLPYKVSTSTSNYMLGMTGAASAGIYLANGYINPLVACPVLLGVLLGAWTGAKLFMAAKPHTLRMIFSVVIFCLALQMLLNGFGFKI